MHGQFQRLSASSLPAQASAPLVSDEVPHATTGSASCPCPCSRREVLAKPNERTRRRPVVNALPSYFPPSPAPLPLNLEVEQGLLGALLDNSDVWTVFSASLQPEH